MDYSTIIGDLFIFFLTVTFFLGLIIFINAKILGKTTFEDVYTDWQMPMLLALYLEITHKKTIYQTTLISKYLSRKK